MSLHRIWDHGPYHDHHLKICKDMDKKSSRKINGWTIDKDSYSILKFHMHRHPNALYIAIKEGQTTTIKIPIQVKVGYAF